MLLICPSCRSGLEVPDGTTALVRCPACKTVFAAANSARPDTADEGDDEPRKRTNARRSRADDDERPRPARRSRRDTEDEEDEEPENRDFDPEPEGGRRRRRAPSARADDGLTFEEKMARRRAFDRAAWGATLIWISFVMFMLSMALILVFFFHGAFGEPIAVYIIFAGVLGVANWVLAAVGVGLCLSGPVVKGHWGYGIAAAVAIGVHLVLLTVLVGQGREFGVSKAGEGAGLVRWAMIPTRLNATMFYITALVYPENHGATPQSAMPLSMITGVAEMVRTVLIMMFLSRLARAALDEDLAHQCTRAAGIASAAPAMMALVMFAFVAAMIETNAPLNRFTLTLFATVFMSVYAIVNAAILPCFTAAREVADACAEPFQSLVPKL
ncbi:MAG TPA: hypothetical protein VGE74_27070 [Gemmata sp.]